MVNQPAARRRRLAAVARQVGYEPPPPKYRAEHDYRGRDANAGIDHHELLLDPLRTALLVIDMQNIFVRPGAPIAAAGGDAIVAPINDLVGAFRRHELPVIWTAWCHRPDGSNLGANAAIWRGIAPLDPDDDLAQIHPDMAFDRERDILLRKPKYSSFWGTDLEPILNTFGITSLVLCGIATDVCVGQTMVEAFHRDYNCAIVADGTATTTPFQEETLWIQENYWGRVLTGAEVTTELDSLATGLSSTAGENQNQPTKGVA
jgi:ureidoacrylate peracid hydrolase